MQERADNRAAPLPRSLLPKGQPLDGAPVWDNQIARIMALAGPELARLANRQARGELKTWSSAMAQWWRGAAALAAASIALLILVERRGESPALSRRSVALGLVASDGDPATFWSAAGVPVDPVLARIVVQTGEDATGPNAQRTVRNVRTP